MDYLLIKNWERYQHYKNRNPPWIKLHTRLLNDRDFIMLSLSDKGLLMQLWILASEKEGQIPFDLEEIKFRLRDKNIKIEDINLLISKKFLRLCKQPLACDNKKCSETETETETELLLSKDNNCPQEPADVKIKNKIPICPQKEIVELWKKIMPELPHPKSWDGAREVNLKTRWRESPERWKLEWWERFFNYIRKSPFLMGHIPPKPGYQQFYVKLDWIVNKSHFEKIREGDYHRGEKLI
jgi:hypothetical protein